MDYFKTIYKVLFFSVLLIAIQSCKTSKNIIGSDDSLVNKSHEQLMDDIISSQLNYKSISGKISLELAGGSKVSGMKTNSQLKIIKDEVVQLSIRIPFVNAEAMKLTITPDSVYIVDRMNKVYAVESLKKLEKEKNINFNFNNMQSLFTNGLFKPGKNQVSRSDYNSYDISVNSGKYKLETKDKSGIVYTFMVDSNDRITSTSISGVKSKYSLDWSYADFIKDGAYVYPTKMDAQVNIDKKKISLLMNYSGLEINKNIDVDKSVPSKYQKVSIIKILTSYFK